VHQLENKVLVIVDAQCNCEVYWAEYTLKLHG